jgi:hypothetical protein
MKERLFIGLAVLCLLASVYAGETRFHQFTNKFRNTPDQAAVVAASSLGGKGTEWLAGGGFQPDGTVVAAGTALGPVLELGVNAAVIGTDAPPPPAPQLVPQMDRGKPKLTKEGKPIMEPLRWTHDNATAFVVRLSSDLQQVKSASRFPWKAGGVTSAVVDADGNIYLAGPASDTIASVGGDVKHLPVEDCGFKNPPCQHVYLAKLSPDAAKVLWLRHFKGASAAPEVMLDKQGKLWLQGPDLRRFDASGKQESVTVVPGGLGTRAAVNPLDGTYARGGEHQWPTGREPWRDPILNIFRPDGAWLYELYNWDGPLVGVDNLRLVSDTAIRGVRYDDEGNLILHVWSDGGNSVIYRHPFDVRTSHGCKGLGFEGWGVKGAMSFAYVVKIESKGYKTIGGTMWCAYLMEQNAPNSLWIHSLDFATDGSVLLAGKSASGLVQTGNAIGMTKEAMTADTEGPIVPSGPYVAVLNRDCSSLRFCSSMPACGQTDVNGTPWGVARGVINGQPKVMFLSGAVERESLYGPSYKAPAVKAVQKGFGGGLCDGHMMLLDLAQR